MAVDEAAETSAALLAESGAAPGRGIGAASTQATNWYRRWLARRNVLMVGGAILVAVAAAAAGMMVWHLRGIVVADALSNAGNLADVLADQTSRSIQSVDNILRETQDHVAASGAASPEQFRALGTQEMHEFLRIQAERVPQADHISLIAADGLRVNQSLAWPIQAGDQSDREYFRHFTGSDDPGLFVSQPIMSRSTHTWTMFLARRLDGPRHEFLGIAIAGMPLSTIRESYRSISLPEEVPSIELIRRDGTVLARNLDRGDPAPMKMPVGEGWYDIVAAGGGQYESPGVFDTTTRIVVVRPLADYPLVVDLGLVKDIVLARWRQEAAIIGGGTALATGSLLFLLFVLRRQFVRLQASERKLATALESMDQGLLIVDDDRRVSVCNRRAVEILDLPTSFVEAARLPLGDVPALRWIDDFRLAGLRRRSAVPDTYERALPNGKVVELGCVPLIGGGGWVATCQDVTARRQAERQIAFLARHDQLTGLPNRTVFRERIELAIAQAGRSMSAAVLCLDLDRFKAVNDTFGHPAGDKLLREVADRLGSCVREVDSIARFGGDEFAVLQAGPGGIEDVATLAKRIIDVLGGPYRIDGQEVMVSASIGVAVVPSDGSDPDTLLKHADIALYRAKAGGRASFRLFEPEMDAMLLRRHALEVELRAALAGGELELFYQPQNDAGTGRLRGFEALMRWRHPSRGLLAPINFIGLCEETGLIVPIGHWAIREACREATSWPEDVRIAVNLSPAQFGDRSLVQTVVKALEESGLKAHRLELEVTETVLLENTDEAVDILHALRRVGVRISMDDFGTGYSSLSYLRRFPFDRIKIDQSFVRDLLGNSDAAAIVRAVAKLGEALGIETTAEGVETDEQLRRLQAEGCGEVQGYLFSRPVPATELPRLLARFHAEELEEM